MPHVLAASLEQAFHCGLPQQNTNPKSHIVEFLTCGAAGGKDLVPQPALYQATLTFHDLIGAGLGRAPGSNPFAISWQGRLALQPVTYLAQP